MQKRFEAIAVLQAFDDRIDYLKAKYRDTQGEERLEWKARFNEANKIKELILITVNNNTKETNNA